MLDLIDSYDKSAFVLWVCMFNIERIPLEQKIPNKYIKTGYKKCV